MAGAWGTSSGGGWAEQVEEEEAKHGRVLGGEEFPSLGDAIKQKPQKKKPQKMSLGAFVASGPAQAKMSDLEIRNMLPTTLRGRGDGDDAGGSMGGAFKDYDNQRRGGFGRDDDDDGRRNRDDDMMPSRADMADDWGKERKFAPAEGGGRGFGGGGFREGGFRDREGGFGDRGPGREEGPSRADETESWSRDNKFQPGDNVGARRGGFEDREPRRGGGGFEDRERRGGFGGGRFDEPSRADEGDWGTRRPLSPPREGAGGGRGGRSFGFAGDRGTDGDRWERRGPSADSDAPPAAAGGATERPRLKLAPRTKPLGEAASGAAADAGAAEAPKKSNPFGAARPREEVLKEKGVDPVKEELKLEHHADLREDTQEEKDLKKEIEQLRLDLEVMKAADGEESEGAAAMQKELDDKEMHLLKLAAELDDKVKYAKKAAKEEAEGAGEAAQATGDEGEFKEAKPKEKAPKPAAPATPSRW